MSVDGLTIYPVKSDLIFDIHTGHCRFSEERSRDDRPPHWIIAQSPYFDTLRCAVVWVVPREKAWVYWSNDPACHV